MGAVLAGVPRTAGHLPEEAEGPEGGETGRRGLHLDGAALQATEGQDHRARRGDERNGAAAGLCRGVPRGQPDVRRLPPDRGEGLLEVRRADPTEGGEQEDVLLPGAAHPEAQGAREHARHQAHLRRPRLLLRQREPRPEDGRLHVHDAAGQVDHVQAADFPRHPQQHVQQQVHVLRGHCPAVQGQSRLLDEEIAAGVGEYFPALFGAAGRKYRSLDRPPEWTTGRGEQHRVLPPAVRGHLQSEAIDRVRRHGRGGDSRPENVPRTRQDQSQTRRFRCLAGESLRVGNQRRHDSHTHAHWTLVEARGLRDGLQSGGCEYQRSCL